MVMLVSYLWRVQNTIPFPSCSRVIEPQVNPLPTAEPRDASDIADPSLVSKGSAKRPGRQLECLIPLIGVALYCLLDACPVFVAGTEVEMSSPYTDELK